MRLKKAFRLEFFFGEICIFGWPLEMNNLVLVSQKINKPESVKERITESKNCYGDL